MGGVLEDVKDGHGGGAEAVDEEGFELALGEVDHDEDQRERLEVGCATACGAGVGEVEVEEGMDQEGAEIFDEEDCAPLYLRA